MRGGQDGIEGPRPLPSPEGPRSQHPGRKGKAPALPAQGLPSRTKGDPRAVPGPPCPRGAPGPAGGYTFLGFRPTW